MNVDELQERARQLLGAAADRVHYAAHPGDEIGSTSADAPALGPLVGKLNELEDLLGPGIGRADTANGLPKLREVVHEMEGLLVSRRGQGDMIFLSSEGRAALSDAIRLLKQVERLYA